MALYHDLSFRDSLRLDGATDAELFQVASSRRHLAYDAGSRPELETVTKPATITSPATVVAKVTERFQMPPTNSIGFRRLDNIQSSFQAHQEIEAGRSATDTRRATDVDKAPKAQASDDDFPSRAAIERIRVQLDTVRANLERPQEPPEPRCSPQPSDRDYVPPMPPVEYVQQIPSWPPVSRAFTQPVSTLAPPQLAGFVPAVSSVAPSPLLAVASPAESFRAPPMLVLPAKAAFPPPPLPPTASELEYRLARLEVEKFSVSGDAFSDRLLDQLAEKLKGMQAWTTHHARLHQQYERCEANWQSKVEALEARTQRLDLYAKEKAGEALRVVEDKSRIECAQLRADIEAAREEARRAHALGSRQEDDFAHIRKSLQVLAEEKRELDVEVDARKKTVKRLKERLADKERSDGGNKSEVARYEKRIKDLDRRILEVRNSGTSIQEAKDELQELRARVDAAEVRKADVDADIESIKKSNGFRSKEAANLRKSLANERLAMKQLQAELEELKMQDEERQSSNNSFSLDLTSERQDFIEVKTVRSRKSIVTVNIDEDDSSESELWAGD